MSYLVAITIGLLVAIAVLHLLQRDTLRMVIGLYIIWNATNLLIVSVPAVRGLRAPVAGVAERVAGPMTDALTQALVLTAIVITFGFTALLIAIVSWLSSQGGSIDVLDFREDHD